MAGELASLITGSIILLSFSCMANGQKDTFRVGFTLFGVDDRTDNVFSFVNVNNLSASKLFNATREDIDHDGIIEIVLSFPNATIANGTRYDACIIVLKSPMLKCSQGYNSPSIRTEFTQFALK